MERQQSGSLESLAMLTDLCPSLPAPDTLCGKFLKPGKDPFSTKVVLAHEAIPPSPLAPSQEDLLLLLVRYHNTLRSCHLPDRALADWEDLAQPGVEMASAMDGFLGGLL